MTGSIFLVGNSGELLEMTQQPYDSEAILQRLLVQYPALLAGDQIDSVVPRRWLLIAREASLPSEQDAAGRWAVDHLFLDQDAIPTIVEVKRSSDTRIRREVVGQMLEYAANAVTNWPIETLRSFFVRTCERVGVDPAQKLAEFLCGGDAEEFWTLATTNLEAQRIRLVFVADVIPPELRRIIEFLNRQMNPAQVLGLEIRQYRGEGVRTLVPRVIGQTAESERRKGTGTRATVQWDRERFMAALEERSATEANIAREIIAWAESRMPRLWWGRGAQTGSCYPMLDLNGESHYLISIWTNGRIAIEFGNMKSGPFAEEARRLELGERIGAAVGVQIPTGMKYPSFPLGALEPAERLKGFTSALDWAVDLFHEWSAPV